MRTILFYNDTWRMAPPTMPDCPVACRLLFDPARLEEADLVVFHVPTLPGPIGAAKPAGQRWVAWSMESEANYPQLEDADFMRRFDLTMTYRRDADAWAPYFEPGLLADLALPAAAKTESAPAVFFASNPLDRSGRSAYVRELMRYLPVDSYGRLLRNRTLDRDDGRATKLATIARYRFTLAFENSVATDYVTEKFFDPLIAGSVPVYLGAPDIDDFAPSDHCYINVADYDDPAALAAYLSRLAKDEDEYARYLAWKTTGPDERFVALVERTRVHPVCRLALLAAGQERQR